MEERVNKLMSLLRPVGDIYLEYVSGINLGLQEKTKGDFVTRADQEIETFLSENILKAFPDDSIVQEEHDDVRGESTYKWVIDPIDGTNNYARQILDARIQIALLDEDEILFGVIYNPNTDEAYVARKGEGAYRTVLSLGERHALKVSNRPVGESLVIYTAGIASGRESSKKLFEKLLGQVGGIRIYGCAALSFELIASGRADCFICDIAKPMDMAPGALIVREAGGKVTDFKGDNWTLDMRDTLVTNSLNSKDFLNLVEVNHE